MKTEWLALARRLCLEPTNHYEGTKKILHAQQFTFEDPMGPLSLDDCGYTKAKITTLRNLYIHEESLKVAKQEWDIRRVKKGRYGSVCFHCYNHMMKSHVKGSHLSSRQMPCLQSVVLTIHKDKSYMDVYYRTTEIFKKFPADLILIRDHMLTEFDFSLTPLQYVRFTVANMTLSPTYFPYLIAHTDDYIELLEEIEEADPRFHKGCCFWLQKYCSMAPDDHNFNQARRTGLAMEKLLVDDKKEELLEYLKEVL